MKVHWQQALQEMGLRRQTGHGWANQGELQVPIIENTERTCGQVTMGALSGETHYTVVTMLWERQRPGSCKGSGSELRALSSDGRRS